MRYSRNPKNLGPSARVWLKSLLSICHDTEVISVKLKESKIITIPYNRTSNKQHGELWFHLFPVHNYLFEQQLIARLNPLVEHFTTGRTSQRKRKLCWTLVLTTFIEAEYQRLINALDSPIWLFVRLRNSRHGLLLNAAKINSDNCAQIFFHPAQ